MDADTIGIDPDTIDENPNLSRVKILVDSPIPSALAAIRKITNEIGTVRYASRDDQTLYFVIESNPLEISLDSLAEDIETQTEMEVTETWVRRVFYEELIEIEQYGVSVLE